MPAAIASPTELTVYKRRWLILFVVAGLNITNAALWISFAPISNIAAVYYKVSTDDINWLSLVYFAATVPFGIVATVVVDKIGLKAALHAGAVLNGLGAVLRILSTASFAPASVHFPVTMVGQVLAAIGQPFILLVPTKVSESWFPDSQRTLATSIATMSNPLGVALASSLSPVMVSSPGDMSLMNIVYGVPAIIFAPLTLLIVRHSLPPEAPSTSALEKHPPVSYCSEIKQLFTNKAYMVLFICIGAGVGLVSVLMTVLQQLLCPKGYSNNFVGLSSALMTGCGIVGAAISGVITDKTKRFEEVAKISFLLLALAAIGLGMSFHWQRTDWMEYLVAGLCAVFGIFAFAAYPVSLELGVECTYPIDESISTGFIMISGQLQGIVYVLLISMLGGPLSARDLKVETCRSGPDSEGIELRDPTVPGLAMAGLTVGIVIFFVLFFKASYKRLNVEHLRLAQDILAASGGANSSTGGVNNPTSTDAIDSVTHL